MQITAVYDLMNLMQTPCHSHSAALSFHKRLVHAIEASLSSGRGPRGLGPVVRTLLWDESGARDMS